MEIFDDVAVYLVLAPLAIVLVAGALAGIWALRHRPGAGNRLSN